MKETLFTKIINGEIPCHKIYEDERTFAFLDIAPATEGHTLVIPKTPVEFVWDLNDEDYAALMNTVKKLGLHLREKTGKRYVGQSVLGTDVPHAHVHLIPFDSSSEYYNIAREKNKPSDEELAAVAEKLRLDD